MLLENFCRNLEEQYLTEDILLENYSTKDGTWIILVPEKIGSSELVYHKDGSLSRFFRVFHPLLGSNTLEAEMKRFATPEDAIPDMEKVIEEGSRREDDPEEHYVYSKLQLYNLITGEYIPYEELKHPRKITASRKAKRNMFD